MSPTIEDTEPQPIVSSAGSDIKVTINTKANEPSSTEIEEDTPTLKRNETMDSFYTDNTESHAINLYEDFPQPARLSRPVRRVPPPLRQYDYTPSPQRHRARPIPITPMLHSSHQILDMLDHDGILNMPYPGKPSIYFTLFPFVDKDVKEWSWLFRLGIEDRFLNKRDYFEDGGDDEEDWFPENRRGRTNRPIQIHHNRRARSPPFVSDNSMDIPSVYLSRALDPAVIPETSERDFAYLIVMRNRGQAGSDAKLLTVSSRKAAGIVIYYEALVGNSVVFVGAVKEGVKKGKKVPVYRHVESVEEAVKVAEDGVLGVIC